MDQTPRVILIDDDEEVLEAYRDMLALAGFAVDACSSLMEARAQLLKTRPAVVLSDVKMPGRDGFAVLSEVRAIDVDLPVILISGHADVSMALKAMRAGAFDFVEKPADPAYVIELLRRAAHHRALVLAHRSLRHEVHGAVLSERIVGQSPAMAELRAMILKLAEVDATVLVRGETGSGKELVARSLHDLGPRAKGPFVAINCAALPPSMLESELFGHEAGAFTGARDKRIGKIEHADKGTLFLDEIESMPVEAQARLLRVLQERQLERLGSNRQIAIDVRVIAATKGDLAALARQGRFREDLVYRLAVVPITIPPLRERGQGDIEALFRHFMVKAAQRLGRSVPLPPMAAILAHSWPGNVRELANAAERAALGFAPLGNEAAVIPVTQSGTGTLSERMAAHEKREIEQALSAGKLLQETAIDLGISRKTLYLKMREHGIAARAEDLSEA